MESSFEQPNCLVHKRKDYSMKSAIVVAATLSLGGLMSAHAQVLGGQGRPIQFGYGPAFQPQPTYVLPPRPWQPPTYTWGQLRHDVPALVQPWTNPIQSIRRSVRCHMNNCWEDWSTY